MKTLVIGSGGREHAIGLILSYSPMVQSIAFAPGNAGTAQIGQNYPLKDLKSLLEFVSEEDIDLVVFGNEQPLVEGWSDALLEKGVKVVGCNQYAAQLEGSKAFAKAFMSEFGIPTASYQVFNAQDYQAAAEYVLEMSLPIVLKADGLAAGKGVLICNSYQESLDGLKSILLDKKFGDAGAEVVIESFLQGEEASVFAFCDGTDYVLLPPAQDHKRIGEGDTGLNTGGMGTYAPAPIANEIVLEKVKSNIIEPLLQGMKARGQVYQGILFVGLMIENDEPSVVEFNCRLGDPETQVVLPLLKSDFAELCLRTAEGRLGDYRPEFYENAALCVVIASGGYPENYVQGLPIEGLTEADIDGVYVFHAGTNTDEQGTIRTSGGRVLGVTGIGESLEVAQQKAYNSVGLIHFEQMYFRKDIGHRALNANQ